MPEKFGLLGSERTAKLIRNYSRNTNKIGTLLRNAARTVERNVQNVAL